MEGNGKVKNVRVLKASGEAESFIPEKLEQSLRAAGADDGMVAEILADIEAWISDGISTKKIYERALSRLGRKQRSAGARYRIKSALMELGPSGHPFERFIGEVFARKGFDVQVGVVVEGLSVTHEMDVIATGRGIQHLVECKYSQSQGSHVSIQVPLYVHSRINDIVGLRREQEEYRGLSFTGWVVTNTRFSSDSLDYSRYYGLELLSWDYPVKEGLREIIERERLYPVTVLSILGQREKEALIANGVVTCATLAHEPKVMEYLGFGTHHREGVMRELEAILV
jgi:hypothetical protein